MYTSPPDPADEPQHVGRHLAGPIAAVWRGLDKGRAAADEFFDPEVHEHRKHDPHMWAHIVRYEAVLSLRAEAVEQDWELHLPHHSGIEVRQDGFRVKVCKAIRDDPQSPGRNRSRKQFFQQMNLSLFGGGASNLFLVWQVLDDELNLALCKPRALWKFNTPAILEWRVPVHYDPLAGLTFDAGSDEDVDVSLRFDVEEDGFDEGTLES